jgi:hypothetical protein
MRLLPREGEATISSHELRLALCKVLGQDGLSPEHRQQFMKAMRQVDEMANPATVANRYAATCEAVQLQRNPSSLRLYTCFIQGGIYPGRYEVQAFCAMVIPRPEIMRRLLQGRYGGELAARAEIKEGFDVQHVSAQLLLSVPLRKLLIRAAERPERYASEAFEIRIEHRIRREPWRTTSRASSPL